MSRETTLQAALNAGAMSERLAGRSDFKKYGSALREMNNVIPLAMGPGTFRPGFKHIHLSKDPTSPGASRTVPFLGAEGKGYILEIASSVIRFFTQDGIIGAPYEVSHSWTGADIARLQFSQDASALYVQCDNPSGSLDARYKPKVLVRFTDTNWVLSDVQFFDGPYDDINLTTTTLTSSASTGAATVTASAATFSTSGRDVGRLIRLATPGSTQTWGWGTITAVASTTSASVTWQTTVPTTASTFWRLGAFYPGNYPKLATFHESRLVYANTLARPNYLYFSESQGYGQNKALFAPSALSGTVTDANSIYFPLSAGDVSNVVWMSSGNVLAVGTTSSEWVIESGDSTKALSPTNTRPSRRTTKGSRDNAQALRVDGTVFFVPNTGSKVNRFTFDFANRNDYLASDISLIAEHLFVNNKVAQMVYAPEPHNLIWCRMDDGTLRSLTFVDSEEVGGWASHTISGEDAFVESIAAVPGPNATYSELWAIVRRTIDGATARYIEALSEPFYKGVPATDANMVDSFLRYDGPPTTTISGLDHLEGETVTIMVDGANHPTRVVTSGEIELVSEASNVVVGLPYVGDCETLDFEATNAFGTSSAGQIRRISELQLRLFETGSILTARADQEDSELNLLEPREADDLMDTATGLISGIVRVETESEWERSSRIRWQFRSPFPGTVSTVMMKAQVNEG